LKKVSPAALKIRSDSIYEKLGGGAPLCTYVAREVPPNVACGPHTHGSWKPLV
jgi:hypothetical protein